MSIHGKWGYSTNEEYYTGTFDTREEAIEEGRDLAEEGGRLWVGQFQAPICEEAIDADDILEKVLCQDDYCGDYAEDALDCTPEQKAELTEAIRKTFGEWLDKHGLRPAFGIVYNAEEVDLTEPKP